MPKRVQIRKMPDELHRRIEARAAMAGISLSDYLLQEIKWVAERPTLEEMRERLERLALLGLADLPEEAVRAERDGRCSS